MFKSVLLTLALAAALTLVTAGCTTTGDPKAGGLFGWSETKAKQRQADARAALAKEEQRSAALKAENQRLQSQVNAKKRDLAALEKKSAAASSGPSTAELAERRRLQNEIDQLNREIEQKNKEALVLMDL